ncbi:Acetamidase [Lasiodiplodia hormozganensis]|uniref:amidase n=1 Tax=Lasiodiplodia hormozganensis TaxID=869390 RepID=A0AA39XYE2_9PEZI|nr:Glutamyl-tRNA amidotransferase subunit [Lasiodiplodia theobromae]KAF4541784.1 Glutamyl-tRNA amidotransferase subunit [Lasiodiplodia theobromae]KAK0642599.1 Acetamidase [Lasiodiplodia hormozganensis]
MASPVPVPNGKPWQEVAAALQAHRDTTLAAVEPPLSKLPDTLPLNTTSLPSQFLTSEEVSITETAPEDLLASLAAGKLTSTTVTRAFLRRAALAQHATNCITELLPARALARAAELDAHLATHGKPVGPLHGLPISVKEHVAMGDGFKTNAGFCAWADHEAPQALILEILWAAGCVFYARTTQPQTLMHLETSNNIFGVTVNPFNTALTSGGSSGGEGALIGFRGSCLGVGTDIGGSIRNPAANNGVWGLRPTAHRLPLAGGVATMKGQEQIVPVIGPLSTSLEGIKVFVKTLIDSKPWLRQVDLVPMKWRYDEDWLPKDPEGKRRLKVGVLWDDGVVKPHPPVLRALKEVVDKLKAAEGVEVVEWTPYKHDLAWEIIASLYFSDGGREEAAAIDASGEPWRPLSKFILKENPHVPKEPYTIPEVWRLTKLREQYRTEYAAHWNATATKDDGSDMVDVILCPVGPGAAPPVDNAKYWGYTSQWNLLDYPSLVFPVTEVDTTVDVKDEAYQPRNDQDAFNHQLYDPEVYRDAPVCLQLVGRPFDDEKVLQAMEYIVDKTGVPFAGFGVKK